MRRIAALLFVLLPAKALGWTFSPIPVCTLRHAGEAAEVVVTFDPGIPEYAISVTLAEGRWPEAPSFAIAFLGPAGTTVTTDRHVLSVDGRSLTVTDRGFGNVLNGLEFNAEAMAAAGATTVRVSLVGAAGPVRAFRDCPAAATS
jgi:hypothetical protein